MKREPFIAHSELTNEIYIVTNKEKYHVTEQAIKAVRAIKALEQEPCEDAISRQAVIDELNKWDKQELYLPIHFKENIIDVVPSVKPQEPKTGRWEWVQYDNNPNIGNWHCSECNRIVSGAITAVNPIYSYKYCPNCGAKMESEG